MKPEDLFIKDFFKQFKTGEELTSFFHALQKRAIEEMLEGELDAHLGYEKHQTSNNQNSLNGHSTKTIKSENGQTEIKVPRDRDSSFQPMIIKKRESFIDGIENIIISMYAKGMSTNGKGLLF